jgi:hypothetical protein
MVRLGVVHSGRVGRVRFPVVVEGAEPFHGLDMQIMYDPTHLRLVAAYPVNAARNALLQYNANVPAVAMIALAAAEPITSADGTVVMLDFEFRRRARWVAQPQILTASIDGQSAEVIDAEWPATAFS